jgi:ribosomal protein S9
MIGFTYYLAGRDAILRQCSNFFGERAFEGKVCFMKALATAAFRKLLTADKRAPEKKKFQKCKATAATQKR